MSAFDAVTLMWLNTVFDTFVSFTFFSKTLDLSVARNGNTQDYNLTALGATIFK